MDEKIEITPKMLQAGVAAYESLRNSYATDLLVETVYSAMRHVENAPPPCKPEHPGHRR